MKVQKPKTSLNLFHLFLAVVLLVLIRDAFRSRGQIESVPYSRFLNLAANHKVDALRISSRLIEGKYVQTPLINPVPFTTQRVDDPGLIPLLNSTGVRFEAVGETSGLRDWFSWLLPMIFLGAFWWLILGRMGRGQPQWGNLGRAKARVFVERDLKVRFSDVAGVDEAKRELQEVVEFLKSPDHYQRLGGRMPKGVLLVGPPGTGKTLLARAVAGEANVPFFSINGSEFVEMFVGLGAARVRDLFSQARSQAPCILFIDEMDALGKARGLGALGGGANDEKEQTLNQLLAEVDGFDPSHGVVLLAATNRPEILDPALLRSGRFDRQVVIDLPDRLGRAEILKIHLKRIKASKRVDPLVFAGLTTGFSGADLENLVNEAALNAARRGAQEVESEDFTFGIERIIAGVERKSRILMPAEKERVAYHEMGHATVSLALDEAEKVHKVSIIPRGIGALGYTLRRPTEDRYLLGRTELMVRLAILLAGRAAETVFLKDVSTGAADDLDRATEIARAMVTRYGMSEELGLMTYEKAPSPFLGISGPFRSTEYSDATAQTIDQEVLHLLEHAHTLAVKQIRLHEAFIRTGVRSLLDHETLEEAELKRQWLLHETPERRVAP